MLKICLLSFSTQISSATFFWGGDFCCDGHHRGSFHMLQHSIVHFFHMNNSLSKDVLKKVFTCNLQTWANQLMQQVALYIRDDTTHYRGTSPTLKDQCGLLPDISNPLLLGILKKSAIGQYSQKKEVIQFWFHPLWLLFPYIWNISSYPVILHK